MKNGVVKWFNSQKGFGFIVQEDGPENFVHRGAIHSTGSRSLNEDDPVRFDVLQGRKEPSAMNVTVV